MRAPTPLELFIEKSGRREGRRPGLTSLAGLALGFALVGLAIAFGGSAGSFFNLPSLLIVCGGTLSAVIVFYSPREVADAARAVRLAIGERPPAPAAFAVQLLAVADYARQAGILALEALPHPIAASPFLDRALGLVVDAADEAAIRTAMATDRVASAAGRRHPVDVLRKAAEIAPAMGLIGTLVGLVQMLIHLDQPTAIGPGMAVALLTTLYGAVLGHMVFQPLATMLERHAEVEALRHDMAMLTALSVSRQENPRRLEEALNGLLPPAARVTVFN
jgi:chemotaxis protein MotA